MAGKTIIISSTNANGSTVIGINGRNRTLAHNVEVPVSDNELALLENSHVSFEVVGAAKASDLKGVAVDLKGGSVGDPAEGTPPGADSLPHPEPLPGVPLVLNPEANETPAGADNLTGPAAPADEAKALEEAQARVAAAAEGTQEPVVVLTNNDPNQTGTDQTETTATGGNEGGTAPEAEEGGADITPPLDTDAALDGSVADITAKLDTYSAEEIDQLLAAEKKGSNRKTLIAALESKQPSA